MDRGEFVEYLRNDSVNYEVAEAPHEGVDGVFVKNTAFDTETHFSDQIIKNMELHDLLKATHQGKNIEQMTRVTGYFSKVGGWNKGKIGELKDRNRVDKV